MDVVLVGLPGSGKSVVGKRLAQRYGAAWVDLDEAIERAAGTPIPQIFEEEGEAGFRVRERAAIAELGEADASSSAVARVIATGGGAVIDPRNRWRLFRGRLPLWLDSRPEVVAQRLRRSPKVRPLVAGRDPIGAVRTLHAAREPFYAAAERVASVAEVANVVDAADRTVRERLAAMQDPRAPRSTILMRATTALGEIVIGEGIAAATVDAALRGLGAPRAILVSEPGAWANAGKALQDALGGRGWPVNAIHLPQGEDAKRLSVVEGAARELARLRVERGEVLVAVGGGALGDTAGFLAATYLRGIPFVQVPTTLVAQLDSSIGGKTGVDLPEGKNLVGAFHQPAAIVLDVNLLRTLPERHLRAALGEAIKMAVLGDEPLWELLEREGPAIAAGDPGAWESGAVAELVERAAWAKVQVVLADEREAAGRATLNLGHSLGHAVEAAAGFHDLLHGEAVAYGLRAAARIGVELGITPPERADRLERTLDALELGRGRLPYRIDEVLGHLGADKKHRAGRLGWVIPTADGVRHPVDVPDELVRRSALALLAEEVPA